MGVRKAANGYLEIKEGFATNVADPDRVAVQQGFLESSNVNVVEEYISFIELSRRFEISTKMMSTVDEMGQQAGSLLRMPS
jgi:flagellar basal-body rod protein FlgF